MVPVLSLYVIMYGTDFLLEGGGGGVSMAWRVQLSPLANLSRRALTFLNLPHNTERVGKPFRAIEWTTLPGLELCPAGHSATHWPQDGGL